MTKKGVESIYKKCINKNNNHNIIVNEIFKEKINKNSQKKYILI